MNRGIDKAKNENRKKYFREYPPSWINRLMTGVNTLKIPAWIVFSAAGLLLFLIAVLLNRSSGAAEPFRFHPVVYLTLIQMVYVLSMINILDKLAENALADYQPILNVDKKGLAALRRRLTILPAGMVWLITVIAVLIFAAWRIMLVISPLEISGNPQMAAYLKLFSNDPPGNFSFTIFFLLWLINFIFVYHTIFQLQAINFIYTTCSRINIFQRQEIYAFSRVSAGTAMGLVLLSPLWIIFEGSIVSQFINIAFTIMAVVIFWFPLRGVHQILKKQKDDSLANVASEKEKVIRNILMLSKKDQFGAIKDLDNALSVLVDAESEISKISTWPWKGETIRQFIGALLVPVIIWMIQFFLDRLLN